MPDSNEELQPGDAQGSAFRKASAAMALLFAFAAFVQWNDPDPVAWILLYGLAATLAALAARGRARFVPNAAAAALFTGLAIWWAPSLESARGEAFTSVRMQATEDEEPRETIGLLLCAVWTAVTAVRVRADRSAPANRPTDP